MSNSNKRNINNLEELNNFTSELADFLSKKPLPYFILLTGDLGAGKTTLTKFLLRHLGVNETVTSPTFAILKQYRGSNRRINHMDAYRLTYNEDVGMYEELFENSLNIIEWPEHLNFDWKKVPHLQIKIKYISKTKRVVEMR